ncbi:uncharacterized protein LODBEIA_P17000 [Lodderomyces beijingensis]|uniref:Uncharacterized protein n=1 Tax=Lodderomyces beijingensis TaxID=1775926 RepID=A0ABP0ZK08_9ASCO
MAEVEPYQDPILSLVSDPNLNRDESKCTQIIKLIRGISERKVNKLCSTSFLILQTLDKIQLKFKSWEFLSLDYNSATHFANRDDKIKIFNTGIADKVIVACTELSIKLVKISSDIDLVSQSSKTLSVGDLMSDDGAMLTSLILRIIKMKNEVVEELSIFYSKAKLILIGRDLEVLSADDDDDNDEGGGGDSMVDYYKSFIIELLRQLNDAILNNDFDAKYECLAVINDLEKMFEKYKLERMIDKSIEEHDLERSRQQQQQHSIRHEHQEEYRARSNRDSAATTSTEPRSIFDDVVNVNGVDDDNDDALNDSPNSPEDTFSEYSMTSTANLPMVHSITHQKQHQKKEDSVYEYGSSSMYKSTISEELPYLMTAFSSAKNFQEDISHYEQEKTKTYSPPKQPEKRTVKEKVEEIESHSVKMPFFPKTSHLPQSALYSDSHFIHQPRMPSPVLGNSLLRTFGIRPQVISVPEDAVKSKKEEDNKKEKKMEMEMEMEMEKSAKLKLGDSIEFKGRRFLLSEENVAHLSQLD